MNNIKMINLLLVEAVSMLHSFGFDLNSGYEIEDDDNPNLITVNSEISINPRLYHKGNFLKTLADGTLYSVHYNFECGDLHQYKFHSGDVYLFTVSISEECCEVYFEFPEHCPQVIPVELEEYKDYDLDTSIVLCAKLYSTNFDVTTDATNMALAKVHAQLKLITDVIASIKALAIRIDNTLNVDSEILKAFYTNQEELEDVANHCRRLLEQNSNIPKEIIYSSVVICTNVNCPRRAECKRSLPATYYENKCKVYTENYTFACNDARDCAGFLTKEVYS